MSAPEAIAAIVGGHHHVALGPEADIEDDAFHAIGAEGRHLTGFYRCLLKNSEAAITCGLLAAKSYSGD